MSIQITTAFVDQFTANYMHLSQQQGSKLRNTVKVKSGVVGKRVSMNQIGAKTARKKTSRHSDVEFSDTPHDRRWITLADYYDADLIDNEDEVRILSSPKSEYMQAIAWALGRQMDDVIIDALTATASTGQDGDSSVAWSPAAFNGSNGSAQVYVPHDFDEAGTLSDTGLTVSKLRTAKAILDGRDVPTAEQEQRFLVCGPTQIQDLLRDEKATSSDYAAVKALVRGDIDTFMGFKFVPTTRTKAADEVYSGGASDEQLCYAYVQSGVGLAIGRDAKGRITVRDDKHFATQVYGSMTLGASRLEEDKIVEIRCQFPAAAS